MCTCGVFQETALLRLCDSFGITDYYRSTYRIIHAVPFSSATKFSAVICENDAFPGLHIVMMKGAPEIILTKCVNYVRNNAIVPLDADFSADQQRVYERLAGTLVCSAHRSVNSLHGTAASREHAVSRGRAWTWLGDVSATCVCFLFCVLVVVTRTAGEGMRVLGFARTIVPARPVSEYQADDAVLPLTGLDFIGMTGLTDPPKEGVPEAITKCREAGIRVFMVTGDHPFTGEAIARQVNLITLTTAHDVAEADGVPISKVDLLNDDRVQVRECWINGRDDCSGGAPRDSCWLSMFFVVVVVWFIVLVWCV